MELACRLKTLKLTPAPLTLAPRGEPSPVPIIGIIAEARDAAVSSLEYGAEGGR